MKIRIRQVLIGAAMIILVTGLFVKTNLVDSDAHNRFRQDLRRLKELDATLGKDILESRYGQMTTYDVIIGDLIEIQHQQEELSSASSTIELPDRREITRLFDEVVAVQEQKKGLIERFKSRNAIINNSVSYFPVATANLVKTLPQNPAGRQEIESLNDLLRETLTYYLLSNSGLEAKITDQIRQLQEAQKTQQLNNAKSSLDIALSHATTILKLKPEVDGLVKQILSVPTASKLEEIITLNDSYYAEAMRQATLYRLLLYTFSVLMLGYIAFIFFKLRKATSALHVINESLERRVEERTEAVQNSRDYLDQIINAVGNPIFVKNRKHQMTLVNDAMSEFMGYPREEVIGTVEHDLFPAEEADVFWKIDEEIFTSGIGNVNEEHFTDAQGQTSFVITTKRLYIDKNGEQFIVGIFKDITARKRAEEELRESVRSKDESLALLDTILATAPIGFAFHNTELRYERINETLAAINGLSIEDHMGREMREVLPEMAQGLEPLMRRIIETGEPVVDFEASGETAGDPGRIHYWLLNFYPVRTHGGETLGVGVLVQDITERKLLEEKLQRGQKLESIGQLAAGIAHEINTPTQYVGDNLRFLQDSFEDFNAVLEKTGEMVTLCKSQDLIPEFVAEMEQAIDRADIEYLADEVPKSFKQALDGIGRISKIVQSMKDFAHPGSAKMRATDLNKAIESTITVASNEWKYVAEMVTNYDEALPAVPCLAGEFNQVVLNMIVNAAHAITDMNGDGSNGKGTISITTTRKDDWAEIRISDTGAGIPEDIRKKIFDPFFTTKAVGKGTGQGLAISHTVIVDRHHGTIDVESETGKGTSFIIRLPLDSAENVRT